MALKLLKDNLPWIAPTAAIFVVASGYLDRDGGFALFDRSEPQQVVVAETVEAPLPVPAAAVTATVEAALATSAAPVTEPDPTSTAAQVAAMVQAATGAAITDGATVTPEVTRAAPLTTAPVTEPLIEPEPVVAQVEPLNRDSAAAFFASAQDNLAGTSSCGEDLKALAASARIYFPAGGLAGEDAGLSQARLIGLVARDCPGYSIQVEGHSDPSGDPAVNLRLSQQRAEAVVARLAASGIDTTHFVATGYGDLRPSGLRGPQPSAYYDRRVEFSVVPLAQNASFVAPSNPWQTATTSTCAEQLGGLLEGTKIFYSPGSITVSPQDMDAVYQLASEAARCGDTRLRIVGQHSDLPGARETVATGRLRALSIMSTLVAAGFESDQILIGAPSQSVGVPGQPALPNNRVDFQLVISDS